MNDLATFCVLATALVLASVSWLMRAAGPGAIRPAARATTLVLIVGVPALTVALYAHLGRLDAVTPPSDPIRTMANVRVASLASRLAGTPDDVPGLRLLARSYEQLHRLPEAVATRGRLVALRPDDPEALVDLADTVSMTQGGSYSGEPIELARRALQIDRNNSRALASIANEAAERGDLRTAIAAWERIEAQVAPDSDVGRSVRLTIMRAREDLAAEAATRTARP